MIKDRDGQNESQHSDVMHRPDAQAHRGGPGDQPKKFDISPGSRVNASGEIDGHICGNNRQRYRERDQKIVITSLQDRLLRRTAS